MGVAPPYRYLKDLTWTKYSSDLSYDVTPSQKPSLTSHCFQHHHEDKMQRPLSAVSQHHPRSTCHSCDFPIGFMILTTLLPSTPSAPSRE